MWYPLQEGGGELGAGAEVAHDFTGRNAPGTNKSAQNAPGWVRTRFGDWAYATKGSLNDAVILPSNLYDLGIRQHGAVSCWAFGTTAGSTSDHIFGDWDSSLGIALRQNGSSELVGFIYPNNHRITTSTNPFLQDVWNHVVAVLDGANWYLYVNGVQVGTDTLGEDIGDPSVPMRIGDRGDGAGELDGYIKDFRVYDRALSAKEVFDLWAPQTRWDLFQETGARAYLFPEAVAGGTTTLTADAGSFAWTGATAGTLYNRVLTAAAASYAWTGQTATTLVSVKLTADAGSYAWSGQDAGLAAAYQLVAGAASYAWSGQDATTTVSVKLTADAGSYAWSGQAATLLQDFVLAADAGSFAWTGSTAGLLSAYQLTASAGSYAWSGQAVTLIAPTGGTLTADAGSYLWAGQAVTLTAPAQDIWTATSGQSTTWTPDTPASTTWS
ncbi:MAG: LamG-like jellyroll fold domain-containing protein [Alphaproteobacteria bacterium]